jgi:hypothetical protein
VWAVHWRRPARRRRAVTAFAIAVIAPDNLTIISTTGAGDLENLNDIVNGTLLLTIGRGGACWGRRVSYLRGSGRS